MKLIPAAWRRFPLKRFLRVALLIALLAAALFALYLDWRVTDEFTGRRWALPARVYARPLELFPGAALTPPQLVQELELLGYKRGIEGMEPGRFEPRAGGVDLVTRPFAFWDGAQPALALRLEFRDDRLDALWDQGNYTELKLARLDPLPIGGIYPAHNEDRVLVKLDEAPRELVSALLAMEDRQFYSHIGVDPRGVARAALSTLTGRGVQGGSTLTQQLVKNYFLTPERTLRRKATEMLMALLLELHYAKDEILEAYLNEIYLGQDRNRAIHGFGLAAHYYFDKPLNRLTLADSALLVGMVKGPALYDPHRHPQRALERRNLVLSEMRGLGYITPEQALRAKAEPLGVVAKPGIGTSPHPAFLELVRRQLRQDYDEDDLRSEGLKIFTTLDPHAQRAAERALTNRLAILDRARKDGQPPLEGAAVVTSTATGEVQALVGGRDVRYQGFNRALDAQRPVGSLLKPAVYLAALSRPQQYTLVTPLSDERFVWKSRGAPDWEPQNYDRKYHGRVPLRTALAESYNVATARLGTELGIPKVLETMHRLGIEHELPPYAATLLGAVDLTPFEVTQMYQTLASGGFRTPLRAIREVLTADGQPLKRYGLSVEQVVEPAPVYLVTAAMQDVVREGTARGLTAFLSPTLNIAGKTGTTDELRDSWFAGFTGDYLAVAWVGYDDNRPSRLTGASGAMTVWGELMAPIAREPLVPPLPENVEQVTIDPRSGLRAGFGCDGAVELPFLAGTAPVAVSDCAAPPPPAPEKKEKPPAKSWWQRLFE
ncbi:MAG: penicillin-binding protein 1B [Gammaproteobacteria bacterium]|nr:MAG: penicillin-binding protein 1B [Gammaproteobacteria bacterium]